MKLNNPLIVFVVLWLFIGLLYELRISPLLKFDSEDVILTLSIILLPFVLAFLITKKFIGNAYSRLGSFTTENLKRKVFVIFLLFIFLFALEIVYCKGVPLYWLITGSSKDRWGFGIPIIHTIINSINPIIGILGVYIGATTGRKRYYLFLAVPFIYSSLMTARIELFWPLIQSVFILIHFKGNKIVWRLFMYFIPVLILFSFIGDLRTGGGENIILHLSDMKDGQIENPFLVALVWPYMYLTTPLNNLIYNFFYVVTNFNYTPHSLIYNLIPVFYRDKIYPDFDKNDWILPTVKTGELVVPTFNVSSTFITPFLDFGFIGVILYSIILGLLSAYFWSRKENSLVVFFSYIIFSSCLTLSFFSDFFYSIPILSEYFWVIVLFSKFKIKW